VGTGGRMVTRLKNTLRGTPFFGVVKGLYRFAVRTAGLFDVALVDVTNGCNLRCPFCYNDWSAPRTAARMSRDHFQKVVELMPLVRQGGVALSCSYEPFLHPGFTGLLGMIPSRLRGAAYFSTNLALPLDHRVFRDLAAAPLHHVNVSVESLHPETYEACRAGARFETFRENLSHLAEALGETPGSPELHFITMACRPNLDGIPELVRRCREEFGAAYHEIRPFTTTPWNAGWLAEHGLDRRQWKALEEALHATGMEHVNLLGFPEHESTVHYMDLPETRFVRVEAEGVVSLGQNRELRPELVTHLDEIPDMRRFVREWIGKGRSAGR